MIDVDTKLKISKAFIQSLLEINTLGIGAMPNRDGFGYMLFSEPGVVVKSVDDAIKWFATNGSNWRAEKKDFNGIYHVRLASVVTNRTVYEADAHPHFAGNIVLTHNGTLNWRFTTNGAKEIEDLFPKDCIDSEKLVITINHYVGDGLLTEEHINKALTHFSGAYAIMVYDTRQPGILFVVRGNDKKLHKLEIKDDTTGERVGLIINTGAWELAHWGRLVKHAMQALTTKKLSFIISEVPELKVFKYMIGTYTLGEPVCDAEKCVFVNQSVSSDTGHTHVHGQRYLPTPSSTPLALVDKIIESCFTIGITYKELCILSEIIFDESFLTIDDNSMTILEGILSTLTKSNFSGRKKEWESLLKHLKVSAAVAYIERGIEFPFFINSKKTLKKEVLRAEKESGLPAIQ
jgi:hypothetical protein